MSPRRKKSVGRAGDKESPARRVACYCRVSVAEREVTAFSSLTAQRESIAAYGKSQGWDVLHERYDDEGYSGSTLARPAFERLMEDARAGRIDILAVYKFDRLSRRQIDFLRTVEELEGLGVQFVSITQNLDTSTSMGRCMLNVMSAFAQLEREVIAERTRDKIGAARRKGMWTGGRPVLGYDVIEKKLVVNEDEAEQVRTIFDLYLDLGSAAGVAEELCLRDIRNKAWTTVAGETVGGAPFNKSTVAAVLTNPLYIGKVRAGDDVCDGEHEAIVTDVVWLEVKEKRHAQAPARRSRRGRPATALLSGIAKCVCGAAMTPTSTTKGTRTYTYYICSRAHKEGVAACPGSRVATRTLDAFVLAEVRRIGRDPQVITAAVTASTVDREDEAVRLRGHLGEVRAARSKLVGERTRLVNAVGGGNAGDGILTRIRELDEIVHAADERVRDVERDLATLTSGDTDPEALTRALEEFNGAWDELALAERARLLDLLLEAVVYDGPKGDIELRFRPMPARATGEVAA